MAAKKTKRQKQDLPEPPAAASEPTPIQAEAGPGSPDAQNPPLDETLKNPFAIVGIGASAGGLKAFESFFSGMPADFDANMAFVLVQHLDPDHKSILSELVRNYTRMQVFEVEDGMVVRPHCVYIIPPNHDLAILKGALHLLEPSAPRGQRLTIDYFFRSLAQDQHERGIGIILSGTGSDGTLGVRAIKGEGGLVMAQDPDSCEYDGMPASVIGTGLADFVLPPGEMPAKIISYLSRSSGLAIVPTPLPVPTPENTLKKIFILVRSQTGHDFSQYKMTTIVRRIQRRMAIHHIETAEEYVIFLQHTPAEVEALFRDMLIGVTSFFRDPFAFEHVEELALPKIIDGKTANGTIRVWSVGCSTGEEAYSLAMLFAERLAERKQNIHVQIFASDIDKNAIAFARAGLYPASIAADVSPERLSRFFIRESNGGMYRIHKSIRDMVIFSEQDVIRDPPFSRVDMISCRNLLIYMDSVLQKKIIPLFYYALNPSGYLFLGTSETVGEFGNLFATLDRKSKLYQRKEDSKDLLRSVQSRLLAPRTELETAYPHSAKKLTVHQKESSLREITERNLLRHWAPVGALVNARGDILYIHGRSGLYLEPFAGAPNNNILKMAREGLLHALSLALHKVVETNGIEHFPDLRVKTNGDFTPVHLTVRPAEAAPGANHESPLYLIILEQGRGGALSGERKTAKEVPPSDAAALIATLKKELRLKEEYLQSSNEELETSNEELKSMNEELQSVNEELQSTNEELETSKEELQSVNEELTTVNTELQSKVAELTQSNNDKNNLLAGTGIGTVFVDHHLQILRFTPAITKIINLIPTDINRSVGHIVSNLVGYDNLAADIQSVLNTLVPKELNVQTKEGMFYLMRIQPYRTTENVIEGAVITFVDVTEMKRTANALREARELNRLAVVVRDAPNGITVQDLEGRILAWNPAAAKMYGWSEAEALTMNVRDRIPENLRDKERDILQCMSHSNTLEPYSTERIAKDGSSVAIWLTATALLNERGRIYAIATTECARKRDSFL